MTTTHESEIRSSRLLFADSPVNTYTAHSIGRGVQQVARLAFPNMASFLASYISTVTTTMSISALNDSSMLAAVGLGNLLGNLLGFSIGAGLMSVLDTTIAQAAGAHNIPLATLHLARGRLVSVIVAIPCTMAMLMSGKILSLLGQDPVTCFNSQIFISWSAIGLLPAFLFFAESSMLRAFHLNQPVLFVNAIAAVIQLATCVYFVNFARLGLMGAGLSMSISNWSKWIMLQIYMRTHREVGEPASFRKFWHAIKSEFSGRVGLSRASVGSSVDFPQSIIEGIPGFIAIAIPSAGLLWSEWWAYEIQAVIAGWLGTEVLASHVICCSIETIMYMFPLGVQQAAAVLVGNSLGGGKPRKASTLAKISLVFGIGQVVTVASTFFYFRSNVAGYYSSDPLVLEILARTFIIVAVYHGFSGFNCVLEGVMRGMRLQEKAVNSKIIVMLFVQLPLAWLLSRSMGLFGLWLAACCGSVVCLAIFLTIILRADFTHCAVVAMKESREEGSLLG